MRYWRIATNDIHRTASVVLHEGPWWKFALSSIIDKCCYVLQKLPDIPVPRCKLTVVGHTMPPGATDFNFDDWEAWHATTVEEWFHWSICTRLLVWADESTEVAYLELDFDELEKKLPDEIFRTEDDEDESES